MLRTLLNVHMIASDILARVAAFTHFHFIHYCVCVCVEILDDGRLSRTKLTSKKYILRKIYTSGVNFHGSAPHRITLTINKQLYIECVRVNLLDREKKVRIWYLLFKF